MTVLHDALLIGRRAIPLHAPDAFAAGDKRNGKAPNVGAGWPDWSATPAAIRRHYARHPDDNVGIRTGDGLVVLDVDPRHGGDVTLAGLEREHGPLPDTREVVTGGNGRHLYFAGDAPSWSDGGLELKGDGCQVVAPPSTHPDTGRLYVWHPGRADTPAPLPAWLVRGAEPAPVAPTAVRADDDDPLRSIPPPEYFALLAGVTPGPGGGFVSCPVPGHADAHPSCRVWPTVPGGWCCFSHPGGRVGGGAFQLTALLGGWPLPLRGADFLNVREALWEIIERRYGVAA